MTGALSDYIDIKVNTFRKRVKNVVTSKGIVVVIECEYVE
jgi:hypothetical protein